MNEQQVAQYLAWLDERIAETTQRVRYAKYAYRGIWSDILNAYADARQTFNMLRDQTSAETGEGAGGV